MIVYLVGIGPTDFPVATGAAAPLDRLIRPSGAVSASLGDRQVAPLFLGLTPGSVALAQLNLQLASDLADGDYAVRVSVAGHPSNAPIISVRQWANSRVELSVLACATRF